MLSHVLAGQLAAHNHPKYVPQKASNIPPDQSVAAAAAAPLKLPLNVTSAALPPNSIGNELLNSARRNYNCNLHAGGGGSASAKNKTWTENDNMSSPDLSDAERFRQATGMTEASALSAGMTADQQKTILLKIPNISESEQLLVSEAALVSLEYVPNMHNFDQQRSETQLRNP